MQSCFLKNFSQRLLDFLLYSTVIVWPTIFQFFTSSCFMCFGVYFLLKLSHSPKLDKGWRGKQHLDVLQRSTFKKPTLERKDSNYTDQGLPFTLGVEVLLRTGELTNSWELGVCPVL